MKLRKLQDLPSLTAGKKVVLTNGCFDILHVGHVRYLEGARKLGDVLVVAINSDASVKRLKGPDRPILTENERVALVSALRCVDHVVVFDEPDVTRILQALRPAIHAKGTDYTEASVPEREPGLEREQANHRQPRFEADAQTEVLVHACERVLGLGNPAARGVVVAGATERCQPRGRAVVRRGRKRLRGLECASGVGQRFGS